MEASCSKFDAVVTEGSNAVAAEMVGNVYVTREDVVTTTADERAFKNHVSNNIARLQPSIIKIIYQSFIRTE